jgi:TIR domain
MSASQSPTRTLLDCMRLGLRVFTTEKGAWVGRCRRRMAMVFISHSSRQDDFAAKVRSQVQARLEGLNWDVRVDMDALKGGDDWRSVIYHWLAQCDAAVVLLGRGAIQSSPWVRREVNILLWRRALGSPLTVVPALLGDVRSAEVQEA